MRGGEPPRLYSYSTSWCRKLDNPRFIGKIGFGVTNSFAEDMLVHVAFDVPDGQLGTDVPSYDGQLKPWERTLFFLKVWRSGDITDDSDSSPRLSIIASWTPAQPLPPFASASRTYKKVVLLDGFSTKDKLCCSFKEKKTRSNIPKNAFASLGSCVQVVLRDADGLYDGNCLI